MADRFGFDRVDFIQIEASVEDEWHDRLGFAHEASGCTLEDLGDLLMDRDGGTFLAAKRQRFWPIDPIGRSRRRSLN